MLIIEVFYKRNQWPTIQKWWFHAMIFNLLQIVIVFLGTYSWDQWFSHFHLLNISHLNPITGALISYITITFVYYWWHRLRHENHLLWRLLHQVHHSANRIELITSFYKHPLEVICNGILSSSILHLLLGATPLQVSLATFLMAMAELFYHWNIKTPYWLGFIIQRPESHCIHHQYKHHTQNYSDLPLWDILFGTFNNPKTPVARCGFNLEDSSRIKEMLKFIDVNPRKPL